MTDRDTGRVSADAVRRDDEALDALLGLDDFRTDDPALRLLARWREELATDAPPPQHQTSVPRVRRRTPPPERDRARPTAPRRRRPSRVLLAASVAVLATTGFGGVAMAAGGADPGSPLFGVTKVIYPQRAAVREHQAAADQDLADARQAAAEGRDDDARRYLKDAERHARQLPSGSAADRVRRDANQVRRGLGAPPPSSLADDNPSDSPSTPPSQSTDPSPPGSTSPTPTEPSPTPSDGSSGTSGHPGPLPTGLDRNDKRGGAGQGRTGTPANRH